MTLPPTPASYSTADVARRLGVSIPTVQRWVDLGHLKAWKTVGGHRRIDAESVEQWFRSHGGGLAGVPSATPGSPSLPVMVVDGNPDDRDILTLLVETALPGASLTLVDNGFQALVALGQHPPAVLIIDIVMPHMDGFEMLRQLSTACAVRPPIILAVSNRTATQFAALGELPPEVKFLPKPVDPKQFVALLREAVKALPHSQAHPAPST